MLAEQAEDIWLKNGKTVGIRSFNETDKAQLVFFYASLSPETLRWGLPPYDERRLERWISDLTANTVLLALHESRVVGNLNVFQQSWSDRLKANGELIIYLHQDFQSVGLGTAMMHEAIRISHRKGLHRLSLSVIADNRNAIKLYEKVGFKHEGVRKEYYLGEDGKYHDVVEMGMLL